MSGTVPTTRVEFGIWLVTAERSQIDPLIAEMASETTGSRRQCRSPLLLKAALSWRPLCISRTARDRGGRGFKENVSRALTWPP